MLEERGIPPYNIRAQARENKANDIVRKQTKTQYGRDIAVFVGRCETAVAGFFANEAHYTGGIFVEDDNRYAKAEVLKILTRTPRK